MPEVPTGGVMTTRHESSRIFIPASDTNWALDLAEELERYFSPSWVSDPKDAEERAAIEECGVLAGIEIQETMR